MGNTIKDERSKELGIYYLYYHDNAERTCRLCTAAGMNVANKINIEIFINTHMAQPQGRQEHN